MPFLGTFALIRVKGSAVKDVMSGKLAEAIRFRLFVLHLLWMSLTKYYVTGFHMSQQARLYHFTPKHQWIAPSDIISCAGLKSTCRLWKIFARLVQDIAVQY